MRFYFVTIVLLTFLVPVSKADIYKCENAQGQIEFSQTPCDKDSEQSDVLNYDESEAVVDRNSIHHSKKYPSQIKLPIRK